MSDDRCGTTAQLHLWGRRTIGLTCQDYPGHGDGMHYAEAATA